MTKKNLFSKLLSIFCLLIFTFVSASDANAQIQGNVPTWTVGTFYGQSPDNKTITLTITKNGRVTAYQNGRTTYGTIYKKTLKSEERQHA